MLVTLQFPFVDSRPFLSAPTGRLSLPTWPAPAAGEEFVRRFGSIRRRRAGGLPAWPGEEYFANAGRAVRFDGQLGCRRTIKPSGASIQPYCAFRRLLADGRAVVRLEIGVGLRRMRPWPSALQADDFKSLIGTALGLPVKVRCSNGDFVSTRLSDIGEFIGPTYQAATTTRRPGAVPPEKWWIESGLPQMLVEYRTDLGVTALPENTQHVDDLRAHRLSLAYCRVQSDGKDLGVWLLGYSLDADRDFLRRLRMQLLRLHAEHQAIAIVFRMITRGRLQANRGTAEAERLQDFLTDAVNLLYKGERFGLPQNEILAAAQRYDELVAPGDRATLLQALKTIRPTLVRKVEAYTSLVDRNSGGLAHVRTIIVAQGGKVDMSSQNISLTNSTIHGSINQVAAKRVEGSFNQLKEASIDDELKAQLSLLHEEVRKLLPGVPPEMQAKLAKNLEEFSEQASSEKPDKDYLNVSKEGLLDAAEAIGEVAKPVIAIVKTILAFLVL